MKPTDIKMKEKPSEQQLQDQYWFQDKSTRRNPSHPVVKATFQPLAEIVARQIESPSNASVLDVGCGNGYLQASLEDKFGNVVGLDYSEEMLQVNPCIIKIHGSSTELPFQDNSFDLVVAAHLLHHLLEEDRKKTLEEMKRVARLGVISFEPNRNNPLMFLFAMLNRAERMAIRFSSGYMKELFSQTGMQKVSIHVQGWIVPNKAPVAWIPIGNFLDKTIFKKLGVDICSVYKFSDT